VANAVHIPFSDLPGRSGEIPEGDVWVYCHSGYRAMIAASLLAARGRHVVSIDDVFANAEGAGLPIARPARSPAGGSPAPGAVAGLWRKQTSRPRAG
jgi:hydroxyacylglutathione hydrolase